MSCATHLTDRGYSVTIIEADNDVGGRIRTDAEDGYLFDRGFQVLQLAYPDAVNMLDYSQLDIQTFPPGVRIWADGAFNILADPLRCRAHITDTLLSKIGSFADRLKLARLALRLSRTPVESLFEDEEQLVLDYLRSYGFSEKMITRFFQPFMTGVCLDPGVRVSNRFLLFVMKMFTQGDVGIPAGGMGQIPKQLASRLSGHRLMLSTPVVSLEGTTVNLDGGEQIKGRAVVIATTGPQAARLTGRPYSMESSREMCFYYSTDRSPVETGFLTLNGSGSGLINSVNFPSLVADGYAPPGKTLISAVVPGYPEQSEVEIEKTVSRELKAWFGNQVDNWELLRTYSIPHVLPQPTPPSANPFNSRCHLGDNLFDCSESGTYPSIQWALMAGRRGAEEIHEIMGGA